MPDSATTQALAILMGKFALARKSGKLRWTPDFDEKSRFNGAVSDAYIYSRFVDAGQEVAVQEQLGNAIRRIGQCQLWALSGQASEPFKALMAELWPLWMELSSAA